LIEGSDHQVARGTIVTVIVYFTYSPRRLHWSDRYQIWFGDRFSGA